MLLVDRARMEMVIERGRGKQPCVRRRGSSCMHRGRRIFYAVRTTRMYGAISDCVQGRDQMSARILPTSREGSTHFRVC